MSRSCFRFETKAEATPTADPSRSRQKALLEARFDGQARIQGINFDPPGESTYMDSEQFVQDLDRAIFSRLDRITENGKGPPPRSELSVAELLATAVKKELEAAEEAALWLVSEDDLDV